jgi:hypothetical protein
MIVGLVSKECSPPVECWRTTRVCPMRYELSKDFVAWVEGSPLHFYKPVAGYTVRREKSFPPACAVFAHCSRIRTWSMRLSPPLQSTNSMQCCSASGVLCFPGAAEGYDHWGRSRRNFSDRPRSWIFESRYCTGEILSLARGIIGGAAQSDWSVGTPGRVRMWRDNSEWFIIADVHVVS